MHLNLDQSPFFRALGLAWRPDIDAFTFTPQIHHTRDNFTKRKVLSQTAQLFDPLGWLSPITIRAKIFMQELWALGFDWDEPLSASLSSRWIGFLQDLQGISAITIPRWIGSSSASLGIEIHGFADASRTPVHLASRIIVLRNDHRSSSSVDAPRRSATHSRYNPTAVLDPGRKSTDPHVHTSLRSLCASSHHPQQPTDGPTPSVSSLWHSGVDYAGPFSIRASRGREAKSCKGYIVIFICFTTSAVHLELVSDYTTEAFIAAYKRFTSRRGICAPIASDCGTNLVGADSELRRLLAASSKEFAEIANVLASHGTQWRFNPPSTPYFGGKWEAGVKSVKFHLKRVIEEATQTFEQFATFLTQVEATLNSRPLCAISDDPRDPSALTPGHFLVGSALKTIPEPSLIEVPVQRLSHWQHSRQMLEHFWKRWSTEYLQFFQNLSKWQTHHGNIKIGSIVLVKNENLPPSVWPLAKVIEAHPKTNGLVRVVTVKTKSSVLKRPIV
ncbi:uncharacterized protein LOC124295055 [Neodiprion lecontei]|uniref:Uncharacterized protein LOC124295055 n=1 Tax=Neodiprion lecontei TaxID=441921 RepID=A0ABM3GFZ9_NEOLC|nr:uncharacterized protein LOC124295055 [Neodiprion lecontei]